MYACMDVCVYIYIYIYIYVYIYIYIYIYTYECMYVCMYVCIDTHKQTYTQKLYSCTFIFAYVHEHGRKTLKADDSRALKETANRHTYTNKHAHNVLK